MFSTLLIKINIGLLKQMTLDSMFCSLKILHLTSYLSFAKGGLKIICFILPVQMTPKDSAEYKVGFNLSLNVVISRKQ